MAQHKEELGAEWAADLDRVLYDEEVEKAIQEVGGTSFDDTHLTVSCKRCVPARIHSTARTSTQRNI